MDASHKLQQTKGTTTTDVHTFGALADADSATGTVEGQTISGVKATGTTTGSLTGDLAFDSTAITSTGNFKPEGDVTGTVTAAGNVSVTLAGNTFNAITGVGELATYEAGNVTGGKATVIDTTKFNGGSAATFTQGSKASLTTSNISYVEEGIKAEVGSGTDAECLIITSITAKSAKAVDTFTANGDDTFNGGTAASLADGFYTAGSDVEYTAPVFTQGSLPTMAAQTVSVGSTGFTGTEVSISAEFEGASKAVEVSGNYDKAKKGTLAFTGAAVELAVGDIAVAEKTVTVTPTEA